MEKNIAILMADLSQIAFELEYGSVFHLSTKFKKVTGTTPSFFKGNGNQKRISIDKSNPKLYKPIPKKYNKNKRGQPTFTLLKTIKYS